VLLAAAADPTLSPSPEVPDTAAAERSASAAAPGAGPLPPPTDPPAPQAPRGPVADLVGDLVRALLPDPTLTDLLDAVLADGDLPRLLRLLPEADLYLQDEVDIALLPTLTRVWCRRGRRGQRHVETPGTNAKQYGFGLVDWRDGWFDWALFPTRSAQPFCDQLRRAVARSRQRGRTAIVLCDNLNIHTLAGSTRLRALTEEVGAALVLVHTPRYDPDSNRIEWLWRALRRAVTHCHQHRALPPLLDDASAWATALPAEAALSHIGSPCAPPPPRSHRPRRPTRRRPHSPPLRRRAPVALPHAA
jgi:hypothetical protein